MPKLLWDFYLFSLVGERDYIIILFFKGALWNIVSWLQLQGRINLNKIEDLFFVIRKKFLSWLAQ